MIDVAWLGGLGDGVDSAAVKLQAVAAGVHDARARAVAHLDRVRHAYGESETRREQHVDTEVHVRVTEAFRTGKFEALTPREQRYAVRQADKVPAASMAALLKVFPSRWRRFVTHYFRRFEQIAARADAGEYALLLAQAPIELLDLRQGIPVADLASVRGPSLIARSIAAPTLSAALRALRARGFEASWTFTAWALAIWAWDRGASASFAELWAGLRDDIEVETVVLPRLRGELARRSWFGTANRGLSPGSEYAPSLFVATLLRAYLRGADPMSAGAFTDRLFASELGDPRVPPESDGWRRVRQVDQASYDRFLEQLISDDLDVFFAHAMRDPRRRKFWAGYLRSIKRTLCILDRATHERLTAKLRTNEQLAGAISRARKFRTRGGESSAQAFCLYFEKIVVVEFSDVGNAAQVYDRAVFERDFERAIQQGQLTGHGDLKRPKLARERILHMSTWEEDAQRLLATSNIFPDRTYGSRQPGR